MFKIERKICLRLFLFSLRKEIYIMQNEFIGFKIEPQLKKDFFNLLKKENLNPSRVLKSCIRQLVQLKGLEIKQFMDYGILNYIKINR
jgi:hypothetical protein